MNKLIKVAIAAREKAYVPYSQFKVGAVLIMKQGNIYSGCNVENASYGLTNCAKRTTIFKAVSEGEREIQLMLIIADTNEPVAPCGACRQVIAEFNIPIITMCNLKRECKTVKLAELLPFAFSGKDVIRKI